MSFELEIFSTWYMVALLLFRFDPNEVKMVFSHIMCPQPTQSTFGSSLRFVILTERCPIGFACHRKSSYMISNGNRHKKIERKPFLHGLWHGQFCTWRTFNLQLVDEFKRRRDFSFSAYYFHLSPQSTIDSSTCWRNSYDSIWQRKQTNEFEGLSNTKHDNWFTNSSLKHNGVSGNRIKKSSNQLVQLYYFRLEAASKTQLLKSKILILSWNPK